MGLTAFNRQRRRVAEATVEPPHTSTDPISEASAPQSQEVGEVVAEVEATESSTLPAGSAALEFINAAIAPEDLTPIPTVGEGAAKIILDERPTEGYESLDGLPEAIFKSPYRCKLEQIEAWEG